ncbi:MAG: M48 family metalloprotease [Vicinamibacterales bacterium]
MTDGNRGILALLAGILVIGLTAVIPAAQSAVELDSYAEWKRRGELIVDGQQVVADGSTRWKGRFSAIAAVPLGDEVRVKGTRRADGRVLASEIDVRPNGTALFEPDVQEGSNELEGLWLKNGEAFEASEDGKKQVIGEIEKDGARVERVRRLVTRLAPPYVKQDRLRVYVIDNKEWNAMAMGNGAVWVFRGIMDDMSDDELAIVVGHELAHYTHEHSRRQMRRGIWTQLAGLSALLAAEAIDSPALRGAAQAGAALTLSALTAGYGRDLEDQADRVGLRYAYEAGFDVRRAPAVWQRFLDKYGESDRFTNFFFSDHSLASARRRNLEQEIAYNYPRRR